MRRKLLIADDNVNFVRIIAEQLTLQGYLTVSAENGVDAVLKFLDGDFDFILMDVVMPKMSGIDAYRIIRKIDPRVGAIICTGSSDDKIKKEASDVGATAFLCKPFSLNVLFDIISLFLSEKN